jgi:hypothetical protein
MGSVIAAQEARHRAMTGRDDTSASNTAIGLGLLGLVGKVVSAATQTQADTRQWDNLPQRLAFAAVKLPPGEHRGRIEFLDRNGAVLAARTRDVAFTVPAEPGRDAVVFLSELRR